MTYKLNNGVASDRELQRIALQILLGLDLSLI